MKSSPLLKRSGFLSAVKLSGCKRKKQDLTHSSISITVSLWYNAYTGCEYADKSGYWKANDRGGAGRSHY